MKSLLNKLLSRYKWNDKKMVLAVSGGLDSMAMAAILKELSQQIIVAHCNFGLRGEASDKDEQLVREWTMANNIECYVKRFDTPQILLNEGGNLQETARTLRYQWFEALRLEKGYDVIATAHHKQDSVETMLINFFKGTGIAGMHGILPQQNKIIRPLLPFTKDELLQYAQHHNIPWREDSSNKKDDYTRNAIRHQLMPVLENMFPNVLNNLAGNAARFTEVEQLYNISVKKYSKALMEQRRQDWYIPILKLKKLPAIKTLLWEMLQPFGFSVGQLDDIYGLLDAESGRFIASSTHRIIKSRDFLILTGLKMEESTFILIQSVEEKISYNHRFLHLNVKNAAEIELESLKEMEINEICVDLDFIHFPLIVRPWKQGDYFYPLGALAKKKKVSKFLIEKKIPIHEKEQIWVLESNRKIIWVIGWRADDRFKLTKHSAKGLFISVK